MQLKALCKLLIVKRRLITKTIQVMKITSVLLLGFCIQVSAKTYSQDLTLSLKNAPLEKVFVEIEKQSGYSFVYGKEILAHAKNVDLHVSRANLETVLAMLFKNQPFSYTVMDKYVVVKQEPTPEPQSTTNLSPPGNINGKVTDSTGAPLIGASVTVKGAKGRGTLTNANGEFELQRVDDNSTLIISFTGFVSQEFKLNQKNNYSIVLVRNNSSLDQVSIIAYGQTTERLNTGDVTTVKSEEIEKQPVSNVLSALEGRVPGLLVTQQSGVPGASYSIQIRGQNSIVNGNDPFYVVDGVPYTSELNLNSTLNPAGGSPLDFINPSDIESISVLKDADATAIYGSRAANGAILITTKKGKSGKLKLTVNATDGFAQAYTKAKFLNTQQYLEMRHEAYSNDNAVPVASSAPDLLVWDTTRYTNWEKSLIGGTAHYTNIGANVSGGNDNTQYLFGANYHVESTVFPNSNTDQKVSFHFNTTTSSSDQRFKMNTTVNYLVDDRHLPAYDLTSYTNTPPDAPPVYNTDGTLNFANSTFNNPLAITLDRYNANANNLIGNALLSYNLLKGLYIKSSFGYTFMQTNEIATTPIASQNPVTNPTGTAYFANNNIHSWIVEPQASYVFLLGGGRFEALVGSTIEQNSSTGEKYSGMGYTTDALLGSIIAAPSLRATWQTSDIYKYNALFGRINYDYRERYIVNFNWRRDGSSRFGPDNQFHNFASAGAAWIFSNEDFLKEVTKVLSFGKLRGSYGTTGNDQIGDYQFYNLYQSQYYPFQGTTALTPTGLSNPSLAWELTKKLEGGIDLGFAKDRVLVKASYYDNRSSNQLLRIGLPTTTGFPSILMNLPATVENSGWEFSITSKNIEGRSFKWRTMINLTINQNKLVAFPGLSTNPSYEYIYSVGKPITSIRVYHSLGVNSQNGIYQFADTSGKPTSTPSFLADRTTFVNLAPKFYGGFQNTFTYKAWQLDLFFVFRKQLAPNPLYQGNVAPGMASANVLTAVLGRWQKPGDNSNIEMFTQSYASPAWQAFSYMSQSDQGYTDASYIRLSNASLAYNVQGHWIRRLSMQGLSLYIHGQNLLTITKFKGIDPETQSSLPVLRVVTGGIQVSF